MYTLVSLSLVTVSGFASHPFSVHVLMTFLPQRSRTPPYGPFRAVRGQPEPYAHLQQAGALQGACGPRPLAETTNGAHP